VAALVNPNPNPGRYPHIAPPLFELDGKSDTVDGDELVSDLGDSASVAMLQGESCIYL